MEAAGGGAAGDIQALGEEIRALKAQLKAEGMSGKAVDKDPDKAMTLAQGSAKERQKAAKLVKLQDLPLPKPGPSPKPKPPLPAKATPKKAGGVPPLPAKAKAKGGLPPLPGQAKAIPLPPTQ